MKITNSRELRCAYELLEIYKELVPQTAEAEERLHDHVCNLKRDIRKYNRQPSGDPRVLRSDFDSALVLLPLPEFLTGMEAATEYFLSEEYRVCRPSMYDCTGQVFTNWFKIILRHGRFWAYHSMSMDV